MRNAIILLAFLGVATLAQADEAIANAQQTLKDQGFYYGEITGEKDADTVAAIRRYQIRNGLQITGELNDETLRSLRSNPAPSPPPIAAMTPSPTPDTSDLRDDSSRAPIAETPVPAWPSAPPQDRQLHPSNSAAVPPRTSNLFVGTPYEASPPDVQRSVIVAVQQALAAREIYRGDMNGVYGSNLEFSLRAYQARVGLVVTGRPDLETLAALELLPGARTPVYRPRRWWQRPRRLVEPPVRGEWIRP
jgi:peptidoglycan hydrolase-like protein with peptidoglycan-binding domain